MFITCYMYCSRLLCALVVSPFPYTCRYVCDCLRGNYHEKTEVRVQYLWHLIDLDESCHEVLELIELCLRAGTVYSWKLLWVKTTFTVFPLSVKVLSPIFDRGSAGMRSRAQPTILHEILRIHGYFHLFQSFHLRTFLAVL